MWIGYRFTSNCIDYDYVSYCLAYYFSLSFPFRSLWFIRSQSFRLVSVTVKIEANQPPV